MTVQLKLSNAGKKSFLVNLESFPAKATVPASNSDTISQIVTGLFFTIFGYTLFRSNLLEETLTPNLFFALAMGTFGGFNLAKALASPKGSAKLVFHKDQVEIIEEFWFTKKKRRLSYKEFKGVRTRKGKQPKNNALQPYQIIELIHEDSSKTLPLYAKRGSKRQTKRLEECAKILGVPIID